VRIGKNLSLNEKILRNYNLNSKDVSVTSFTGCLETTTFQSNPRLRFGKTFIVTEKSSGYRSGKLFMYYNLPEKVRQKESMALVGLI
jgi:hypothetical protein